MIEDQKRNFERARSGESVSFLQETKLPNGTTISANGKYEPVFNEDGGVESIAICVDDVTPMVKTQEALKVANETKDKLFSIVAHDIRSPLNMFQTFLIILELHRFVGIQKKKEAFAPMFLVIYVEIHKK